MCMSRKGRKIKDAKTAKGYTEYYVACATIWWCK